MNEFTTPLIDKLSKLVNSNEYSALDELYNTEEQRILRELVNAKEEYALWQLSGQAKMLKKIRHLPEETIDAYLREKEVRRHND